MGTVVSFDLRDPVSTDAFDRAVRSLHQADAMFSTYRSQSAICRLGRGELTADEWPADVTEVLSLCEVAHRGTNGYFDAYATGRLDPSGLVKGWAVRNASDVLVDAGSRHHSVNGGGDIQLVGGSDDVTAWRVGIADPRDPSTLLAVLRLTGGAVATSGTSERGRHIIDPRSGSPADHYLSVTITASSIVDADVLATAAFAMGPASIDWVGDLDGVEGLFLTSDGQLLASAGLASVPLSPA
jgi:thiamine biosynthesis lipoprotein